ncbi:putative indole-3-pyruvate monooxygenase YUCCA9 [Colletotrichum chlorophyti]|uniref:Putative indole-3-pyruvate monooxygenase YUCCA9 n=1 Tax=Colletotrichum chlorophyti TaxID=708187 RepID=A0A1Q8RT20_9PEZI|nr:putative indole-3-pyruvate monooxygenase YUCCA9 [Colletotrichum chlorophyti]
MDLPDFPPKVDIQTQIYDALPQTAALCDWDSLDATQTAGDVVAQFAEAVQHGQYQALENMFADTSSYWKDTLSLTAHIRTFKGSATIAAALIELQGERKAHGFRFNGGLVMTATEDLKWLDCGFSFRTASPRASCRGKMMLIPGGRGTGYQSWKVWSMSTWLVDFEDHPEDESLLRLPSSPITDGLEISTDVLIVGGGNAGILLAARLKAMGADFVVIDRNESVGDNWSQRYDCMRFHINKSFCETPYIPYPQSTNHGLTRDELAAQIRAIAQEFDLGRRVLHSTTVSGTDYDPQTRVWQVKLKSRGKERVLSCACVVLATGAGFSGAAPLPDLPGRELFKGPSIHSLSYRNAATLRAGGAKSAVIIGSANTAFDVMVDCYNAGLKTTMVQRSETYVVPMSYFSHPLSFGIYDILPTEEADAVVSGGPLAVGGPLVGLAHYMQAQEEPNRYDEVRKAGLRVQDSLTGDLIINLIDRCGGHFVDMDKGMELITTRKVGIRSGAVPKAYTPDGLELADGSKIKADAVVWCTGFGNMDARKSLSEVLGDGAETIASKLEPTWGADAEGEIRGLFKRHPGVDNLWIFAGGTAQHRWFSKVIALQIKGILEGILPNAYRRTPEPTIENHLRLGNTWAASNL